MFSLNFTQNSWVCCLRKGPFTLLNSTQTPPPVVMSKYCQYFSRCMGISRV